MQPVKPVAVLQNLLELIFPIADFPIADMTFASMTFDRITFADMTFLSKGDPVPWFTDASSSNPAYHFESVGGYRIILSFLGHCSTRSCAKVLQDFAALHAKIRDRNRKHVVLNSYSRPGFPGE